MINILQAVGNNAPNSFVDVQKVQTLIFTLLLLTACTDEVDQPVNKLEASEKTTTATSKPVAHDVSFKMVNTEQGEDDASLALGYWQSLISYPVLEGAIDEAIKRKLNNQIVKLTEQYQCEKKGDYSFSSEVKYLDAQLLSMTYEIMWLCPGMPSPDSTVGALNYSLTSGEELQLNSEFQNNMISSDFSSMLSGKYESGLSGDNECPAINNYAYFYKTETSVVFGYDVERHSDSGCRTEIELTSEELKPFLKPDSLLLR